MCFEFRRERLDSSIPEASGATRASGLQRHPTCMLQECTPGTCQPGSENCQELTLSRGAQGYGFTVNKDSGLVEKVTQGGNGALAGLCEGDVIVGVNDTRLRLGEPFASHLSRSQCQREGSKLKLAVHRRLSAQGASDPNKRQRTARQQPGMQALDGVRLGDGLRTHAERLANTFATGTANSL